MNQEKFNWILGVASFAAMLGMVSPAQASSTPISSSPSYCPGADIGVGDVTYGSSDANACYGVVSGNINGAPDINGLNLTWGNTWSYLDDSDSSGGPYQGIQFTVTAMTAATETNEGTWKLTGVDKNGPTPLNLPFTLDLAVALKGGDRYALWYFDNVIFAGNVNGTWEIEFKNKGGEHPDLSHIMVFGSDAHGIVVPVPAAAWLLGSGLLGLAGLARRKVSL